MTAVFKLLFVTTILLFVSHINAQESELSRIADTFVYQIVKCAHLQRKECLSNQFADTFEITTYGEKILEKAAFVDALLDSAKQSGNFNIKVNSTARFSSENAIVGVIFKEANKSIPGKLYFYLEKNENGQFVAKEGIRL